MNIYVILLDVLKKINGTEMGVFLMDMLQQVIDTFKLNVLAVENVPESIRPLINLQEVLPFYRFIALLMLLMQSVGVKEEVLKSIKLFYRRV
ncbi:hypothetical protein POF54_10515 [Bacillus thuringiensis]|nr:hypothetical protein [Bacillus thuringiensis]